MKPAEPDHIAVSGRRTDVKHGVCKPCGRRRILWLPAALCDRCLMRAAQEVLLPTVDVPRDLGKVNP